MRVTWDLSGNVLLHSSAISVHIVIIIACREGHKNSDMKVLADLLSLPLWEVPVAGSQEEGESYTLERIKNYIARYEVNNSLEQGYLLLDYHWQHHMGDLTFHRENFPQLSLLRHTVSWAKRKLAITINPFVSVESEHFREGVEKKLFVMERNSTREKFIPALTWFMVLTGLIERERERS